MEFRPGISLVGYQVEIRQKSRSWQPTLCTWSERGWGALKTYMTKIRTRYHGISTGISKFRFLFSDFHGISSSILNFGNPAIEIRGNLCRYWVGFPYSEFENKNSATRYPVFCGVSPGITSRNQILCGLKREPYMYMNGSPPNKT